MILTTGIVRQNLSVLEERAAQRPPEPLGGPGRTDTRRADLGLKVGSSHLPGPGMARRRRAARSKAAGHRSSATRAWSAWPAPLGARSLSWGRRGGPRPVAAVRQGGTRARLAGKSLSGSPYVTRSVSARGEIAGPMRSHLVRIPLGVRPSSRRGSNIECAPRPPGLEGFLPQGIRRCRHAELGELEVSLVGSCHRGTGSLPGGLWLITRSSAGDPRRSERCHLRQRVAPFWGCRTSASPAGVARNWWTWRQEGHIRQLSWQKLSLFLVDVPHRQSRPLVLRPSLYRVPRLGPRASWLCAAGFEKLGPPRLLFRRRVDTARPQGRGPNRGGPTEAAPGAFAAFDPGPRVPRCLSLGRPDEAVRVLRAPGRLLPRGRARDGGRPPGSATGGNPLSNVGAVGGGKVGGELGLVLDHERRSGRAPVLEALLELRSGEAPAEVSTATGRLLRAHAPWALDVVGLAQCLIEAAGCPRDQRLFLSWSLGADTPSFAEVAKREGVPARYANKLVRRARRARPACPSRRARAAALARVGASEPPRRCGAGCPAERGSRATLGVAVAGQVDRGQAGITRCPGQLPCYRQSLIPAWPLSPRCPQR